MTQLIGIGAPTVDRTTLNLTENAISKVNEFLKSENRAGQGLRVAVVGGGCSGLQYHLAFEAKAGESDKILHFDGFDVFVDPMSLTYLAGVRIDYVEGLSGAGFKIENPNAAGSCGCGHSFQA
jgi:iron-sulfur cluster assembly accessory protein